MKRLFKKTLIYLVMFMTILPSWFLAGSIQSAKAAGGENAPTIENFDIINPIFSPNGDGIKDTVTIDVGFSKSVKAKIDIKKESDKTEVINLYQSNSVKNPDPKVWNGKDSLDTMVSDGNYLVEVSYNEFFQDKTITVDTKKPEIVTNFDDSNVIIKSDLGQVVFMDVEYSEPMDKTTSPEIVFDQNATDFNKILKCSGSWNSSTKYRYSCLVDQTAGTNQNVSPSTMTISGGSDLAGNSFGKLVTKGTTAIDTIAPVAGTLTYILKDGSPIEVQPDFTANEYKADAVYKTTAFKSSDILTNFNLLVVGKNIDTHDIPLKINGEVTATLIFDYKEGDNYYFKLVVTDKTKLNTGRNVIEGIFSNEIGNQSKIVAEIDIAADVTTTNVSYSTTDPTNGEVTATLSSDKPITITNNSGSTSYKFSDNGNFTFEYLDINGKKGEAIATVNNIYRNTIIDPTVSISGKSINIKWNSVPSAQSYNVYISSKANGVVSATNYVKKIEKVTATEITQNVGEYGSYYVVITSVDKDGNESVITVDSKQLLVEVSAPANAVVKPAPTTPEPVQTAPTSSVAPSKVKAAASVKAEDKTTVQNTDQNGQIKGDQSNQNTATEKTNWTPWIVLFALIILAGAATGGYFYWFNDEEVITEVKQVKKEVKKEVITKKVEKIAPTPPAKAKKPNKKSKRW